MNILHIASIKNNPFSGVCVVVPQHISAQSNFANVALLNITNTVIAGIKNLRYDKPFDIEMLPSPYDKPDVAIFNEAYHIEYLAIAKQMRHKNIPYIIIPHGELQRQAQKNKLIKKKAANLLLWNKFIYGAKAIQCLSQREVNETSFKVAKFIGTNGVAIQQRIKQYFNTGCVRFLYIGRLDYYTKGLDLLVEAAAKVGTFLRDNSCTIDIYGPDYQGRYDHVEGLINDSDVGDIIKLHHEVTGEVKEKLLLDSDIFIQTSRFEGMPLGIIEALSYGIPCLITEGTTLGKYISSYDAGWASETNVDSISEKLVQAVQERKTWRSKRENAVELINDNFTWSIVADDAVKQYEKLI